LEQEVEVGAIPMEIWHGDLVPRDHSSFEFQVTNSNLAKDQGCSNSLSLEFTPDPQMFQFNYA
jgi:hypothetical protein